MFRLFDVHTYLIMCGGIMNVPRLIILVGKLRAVPKLCKLENISLNHGICCLGPAQMIATWQPAVVCNPGNAMQRLHNSDSAHHGSWVG